MTMEETVRALADELMLYFGFLADHNHIKIRESLISMYRAGEQAERDAQKFDAIADRAWIAGATVGFNLGVEGNGEGLNRAIEGRRKRLAAIRRGPSQG